MATVLVVDDDALIREVTGDILAGPGHKVFTAKDSVEGLDILKKEDIEVVLLDVVMPLESGFDMIPRIKEINPDAAIIIMTAYVSTDSAIEAIRLGAYDYIKKPINSHDLLHAIDKVMERYSLVLENRSLVETLEERIHRLELFEKISRAISSTLDLGSLLEKVMEIMKAILDAEACSILLLDEAANELVFSVALGEKGKEVKEFRIKPGEGIAGWVLEQGEPIRISNAEKDSRFFKGVDDKTGFKTTSIMAVPLQVKDKTLGVIEVINKIEGDHFSEKDLDTLVTMSGQIAVSIDNARMTDDLKKSHDQVEEYSKNLEIMVKKRTEQLESANEEIKSAQSQLLQTEKLSSLGQLAAGIAHEINNPIGFINSNLRTMGEYADSLLDLLSKYEGVIDALKRKKRESFAAGMKDIDFAKRRMKFDFIMDDFGNLIRESREGAYRIYHIVRDLRDFSRADDAKRKFVDIHHNIDSTLNIVWNELKYKTEVVKEYGQLPEIECLPTQLNQVFTNLLVNAAHAIEKKGKITIKTRSDGDNIFIEISDTGSGIPPENLNKIFDPFFTTKEPGRGTGLGLSIAYNIIKRHNGEISVRSKQGEGATFTIRLPVEMGLPEGEKVD